MYSATYLSARDTLVPYYEMFRVSHYGTTQSPKVGPKVGSYDTPAQLMKVMSAEARRGVGTLQAS